MSKQLLGQGGLHASNVLLSALFRKTKHVSACGRYVNHLLLDTTIGVGVIYLLLKLSSHVLTTTLKWPGFVSGVYGTPPRLSYFARQAAVYVAVLMTMKGFVVIILVVFPGLYAIGGFLIGWTKGNTGLQVVFVLCVLPLLLNVLSFWLLDNIVRRSHSLAS